MLRGRHMVWIVPVLLMGQYGCRTEPVSWRNPLHGVILLHDSLGWSELVPDSLWTEGEDGLVLEIRNRQNLLDVESLVPDLDTAWTEVFTLPFIGGPIPVAPGAEIWGEAEAITFPFPSAGLRRVRLSDGELTLTVISSVQGPLELRYALIGADFPPEVNGGGNEIVMTVDGDTAEVVLPLGEVEIDLDGDDNLIFSKLNTEWSVGVSASSADPVGVFGDDELSLSVALAGLRIAQVEGRFDAQDILLEDTVFLDGFGALQELEVGWSGLDVGLRLHNTSGVDFTGAIESVFRLDSVGENLESLGLDDPVLGAEVFLPRATVSGEHMGAWTIESTSAEMALSSVEGNLGSFMSSLPDGVAWSVGLGVNPLGDVTGGHDRIDLDRLPELETVVSAPLAVSSARAVLVDTLEVVPPEWLDFIGHLDLTVESSLPVGAVLRMSLVDLPPAQQLLGMTFGPYWWRFEEVVLQPGSGAPDAPSIAESRVDFMQPHFEALRQGARLRVEVELESADGVAQFDAAQSVVVRGHLTGDAIISIQ